MSFVFVVWIYARAWMGFAVNWVSPKKESEAVASGEYGMLTFLAEV